MISPQPPALPGGLDNARKFITLDALRGVAALAVVQFHTSSFAGRKLVHHGYLAVDFFFLLSGFVLSFAYSDRLDRGWPTAAFLKVRWIRLYPLYFLALASGITLRLLDHHFGKPSLPAGVLAMLVAAGLFVLPVPFAFADVSRFAFPLNVPSWSLFFEAVANVLHALFLRRRSTRFLVAVTAVAWLVLAAFSARAGTMDLGSSRTELLPGLARVVLFYVGGMVLFRLWQTGRATLRLPAWLAAVLLVALLIGPAEGVHTLAYETLTTLLLFPALLLASANSRPPLRFAALFQSLGVASYAVYILHVPLAAAYFAVCARLFPRSGVQTHWLGETLVFLVLIVTAALVADRFYDQPVRRCLRNLN